MLTAIVVTLAIVMLGYGFLHGAAFILKWRTVERYH